MKTIKLEAIQELARNRNGISLATEFVSANSKLLWKCSNGHIWEASWFSVKHQKSWCPVCAKCAKPSIEELQLLAKKRNGILLSTEYKNATSKLKWQCENGHVWSALYTGIKFRNDWCPQCSKTKKPTLQYISNTALLRGGALLSTKYINNKSKLLWQCEKGHTWEASWYSINIRNSWCPYCQYFKTEQKCRHILEALLTTSFLKTRIIFNGSTYELDGYSKSLHIAFEYNGEQHYKYPNFYHKTKEDFLKQQQSDLAKLEYCKNNNIKLLVIPFSKKDTLDSYLQGLIHDIQN
jgi:thiol-disulfide isomerase/thioredoxin